MSLFVRSRWRRGRSEGIGPWGWGGRATATTEVATLHCSKLSSDYFVLTRGGGVSSFFLRVVLILVLLTRGSPILFSLLCLTCPSASLTRPRPQFPPILFSKQVCKTQFSCRLTSHLIARWSMLSLFSSSLLRSVHNFSLYFSLTLPLSLSQSSACHFFSSTNNSFFLLHSRQRSWRGDKWFNKNYVILDLP